MPLCIVFLKPDASVERLYVPGGSSVIVYVPSAEATVSRTTVFVWALVAVIFAFGTAAPELSVMAPTISALETCAESGDERNQISRMHNNILVVAI